MMGLLQLLLSGVTTSGENNVLFFVSVNQVLVRLWARRRQHV